jgi:ABC-2 type transport system ATP-binding protein
MAVADGEQFIKELSDTFQIATSHYNSQDSQLEFQIQLPSEDTRSLLTHLSSKGTINNFVETIPTANDIFIKTVQSKTIHE